MQWPFAINYLGVQFPPLPVPEHEVLPDVPLDDAQANTLVLELLVALPHDVTTDPGLEEGHDLGEALIAHVLKLTEHTGAEEYLGVTNTVLVLFHLKGDQDLLRNLLAIGESLGDDVGGKDGVSGRWGEKYDEIIVSK